jgi:hypothetical protein
LVSSTAAAYGDGTLATALNVAVHYATLNAHLDGDLDVDGNLSVTADLVTLKNDYAASSTVGTGQLGASFFGSTVGQVLTLGILRGFTAAFNKFVSSTGNALKPQSQATKLDVSAAVNAGLAFNVVDVRIGPSAQVQVGGDMLLQGSAQDLPETSSLAFLSSSKQNLKGKGAFSQREDGIAAAITGAYFENQVDVTIGAGAVVGAGSVVTADVDPHAIVVGNPARVKGTRS